MEQEELIERLLDYKNKFNVFFDFCLQLVQTLPPQFRGRSYYFYEKNLIFELVDNDAITSETLDIINRLKPNFVYYRVSMDDYGCGTVEFTVK